MQFPREMSWIRKYENPSLESWTRENILECEENILEWVSVFFGGCSDTEKKYIRLHISAWKKRMCSSQEGRAGEERMEVFSKNSELIKTH